MPRSLKKTCDAVEIDDTSILPLNLIAIGERLSINGSK